MKLALEAGLVGPRISHADGWIMRLSRGQQWLFAGCFVVGILGPLVATGSLLGLLAFCGLAIAAFILSKPSYSLWAFILLTDVVTIRPREATIGGAPTPLDLALGMGLAMIIAYWILRIRIIENQPLSTSRGQLCLILFFVWSGIITCYATLFYNNPFPVALREILNLMPLLILPLLYGRYVEVGSKEERRIIALTLFSAFVVILWSIHVFRSNVVKALYLYQTGRAAFDLALVCLVIFAMTSYLMLEHKRWQTLLASAFLMLASVGLVVSFTRTLYVAVTVGVIVILFLGSRSERNRGFKVLARIGAFCVAATIPIMVVSRVFRLLLLNYGVRFLSTQHAKTDRSLLSRFAEWSGEWKAILESPVFGHGFGASFRFFDMLTYRHLWIPFSHNSYLYIIFKSGFIGGALFFAANMIFVAKGFKLVRLPSLSPETRMMVRAALISMIIQLVGAFTGPTFCSKTPMVWLGLVWGYLLSVEKSLQKEALQG